MGHWDAGSLQGTSQPAAQRPCTKEDILAVPLLQWELVLWPAECHLNFPLDFLRAVLLHVASICLQSFGENALGHFHSICLEDYLGVMYRVSDNQSSSKPLSGGNTARVAWKKLGCEQVACSFLLHTGMFRLLAVTCMGHLSTEGVLPPFLVKLRPDTNRNKGARKSGNKGQ